MLEFIWITLIGLVLSGYLFSKEKWTQGTILACFSLVILFTGTVQIPQISASIENSFNFYNEKIGQIEKEIKSLRLNTLHVSGEASFDEGFSSGSNTHEPATIVLSNKEGKQVWKITIQEDDLIFQSFENGEWVTRYTINHSHNK